MQIKAEHADKVVLLGRTVPDCEGDELGEQGEQGAGDGRDYDWVGSADNHGWVNGDDKDYEVGIGDDKVFYTGNGIGTGNVGAKGLQANFILNNLLQLGGWFFYDIIVPYILQKIIFWGSVPT